MYKVTKDVNDFSVAMANNGFVLEYSGRNDDDDWTQDKIVMPDLKQLISEIQRLVEIKE